jgi:hypothetical protein
MPSSGGYGAVPTFGGNRNGNAGLGTAPRVFAHPTIFFPLTTYTNARSFG